MRFIFSQKGLSLVEMLVVIVIVSLVSTLLVQGFGNALSLYNKVQGRQQQLQYLSMSHNWIRSSIAGSIANRLDQQLLAGGESRVSLVTMRPLLSEEGVQTKIEWLVDEKWPNRLRYRENERELDILFPEDSSLSFEYLHKDQGWIMRWPIESRDTDLPNAIRVKYGQGEITSYISGQKKTIYFIDEIEFGRE